MSTGGAGGGGGGALMDMSSDGNAVQGAAWLATQTRHRMEQFTAGCMVNWTITSGTGLARSDSAPSGMNDLQHLHALRYAGFMHVQPCTQRTLAHQAHSL